MPSLHNIFVRIRDFDNYTKPAVVLTPASPFSAIPNARNSSGLQPHVRTAFSISHNRSHYWITLLSLTVSANFKHPVPCRRPRDVCATLIQPLRCSSRPKDDSAHHITRPTTTIATSSAVLMSYAPMPAIVPAPGAAVDARKSRSAADMGPLATGPEVTSRSGTRSWDYIWRSGIAGGIAGSAVRLLPCHSPSLIPNLPLSLR